MFEITNTITYVGAPSEVSWALTLPAGWTLVSNAGSDGDVQPAIGATNAVEWDWSGSLATSPSPITFTYVVSVPFGSTGSQPLSATVSITDGGVTQVLAAPDPLPITLAIHHSADEDKIGALNLSDLTRVIELYNTHSGSIRTGCYLTDEASEDGFAPDASRATSAPFTLPYYHSADEADAGSLTLSNLTRVIALYNYHAGSSRTGQYSIAAGTEDGFQPGP